MKSILNFIIYFGMQVLFLSADDNPIHQVVFVAEYTAKNKIIVGVENNGSTPAQVSVGTPPACTIYLKKNKDSVSKYIHTNLSMKDGEITNFVKTRSWKKYDIGAGGKMVVLSSINYKFGRLGDVKKEYRSKLGEVSLPPQSKLGAYQLRIEFEIMEGGNKRKISIPVKMTSTKKTE